MKISALPYGLKELALLRQSQCKDSVYDNQADDLSDAFYWAGTMEGDSFWGAVDDGNFTPFYNCKVVNFKLKQK